MENNTSLAGLLEPFQSDDVEGIEIAIRRAGEGFELDVACRSSKGATFSHEGKCAGGDCGGTLRWMIEEAIARAIGSYKEQLRPSAAPQHASAGVSRQPSRASVSDDGPMKKLSEREKEVLQLLAEGDSNKKIAVKLGISVHTVNAHRVSIMHKTDIHDARGLTRFAAQHGLIDVHRR